MSKQYWLVKQEPDSYAWTAFARDGTTAWTGVRNFAARNHLRSMKKGDLAFYYHSGAERQVVGLARVAREAYPDPTATEGDWSCVELSAFKPLRKPVTLDAIRNERALAGMILLKQTRLSVSPVTPAQFERILTLAETNA